MPSSPLVSPGTAPTFALPGIDFTGLAAPSRGATDSIVWIVEIRPGTPGAPHRLTREEVIVCIDGKARATVAGIDYELEAGGAVIVPPDTDFALANPYESPFRAVAVLPVGGAAVMDGDTFVPPWAR